MPELTLEQADHLLLTPKWVVSERGRNGIRLSRQPIPMLDKFSRRKLLLVSEDGQHEFRMDMRCSEKRAFTLSIHHQADPSHTGLLRVDYNGRHSNPSNGEPGLPERFVPYIGASFAPNQPHIHYHVPGYKSLAWAVPLTGDDFPVKEVAGDEDIPKAIIAFGAAVFLQTELRPQASVLRG